MNTKSKNNFDAQQTVQKFEDIDKNPIALSEDYTKQIIEQLNTDIASHFITFYQLKKQHWIVEGPDWKHISAALDTYAKTNLELAEELAERITLLGGIPVSNPSRFEALSYVQFEGEHKYNLRTMLENDLRAEQNLITSIRERIDFAKENRDHGIDDLLKDVLEGHEKTAHELHHYLQEQSLEKDL
jgi:starvation-inducible DNA-binding protein